MYTKYYTKNTDFYSLEFWNHLQKTYDFQELGTDEKSKKIRTAKFDEILQKVNSYDDEPELLPYLRVVLCYFFISRNRYKYNYDKIKWGGNFDVGYREIAYYITTLIDDIKYVAANDLSNDKIQIDILSGAEDVIKSCTIRAIARYCSADVMRKFISGVVNLYYNVECKPEVKVGFFARAIHEYTGKKDYPLLVEFGEWVISLLEKENVYESLSKKSRDFRSTVESMHVDLEPAFRALGVNNAAHDELIGSIKRKEEKKARERSIYELKQSIREKINDVPNKKKSIAVFEESMKIIEDEHPNEIGLYKAEISNFFMATLYTMYKKSGKLSFAELTAYLPEMLNNIDYMADNVPLAFFNYAYFYQINDRHFISEIFRALCVDVPQWNIQRFMDRVVPLEYFNEHLEHLVEYFRCVTEIYTATARYENVVRYGEWFVQLYKEREKKCSYCGFEDFKKGVSVIYFNLDKAYKSLNIKTTAEHNAKILDIVNKETEARLEREKGIRKIEARKQERIKKYGNETPQQMRDRERAELYDLAERCKAVGDMDGYRGYMSALGDIGR